MKKFYLWLLKYRIRHTDKNNVICYLMSFSNNNEILIEELKKKYSDQFIIGYTKETKKMAESYAQKNYNIFSMDRASLLKNNFKKIAQAKIIVVDNYFPELSILTERKIVQVWHATGAIKSFGWEDPKTYTRSKADRTRFQKVYDSFTDIVVGSQIMGDVFIKSYRVKPEVIRYIGSPRTDKFYHLQNNNPINKQSPTILYVPTYRDSKEQMGKVLNAAINVFKKFPKYTFLIKLHPHVKWDFPILHTNVKVTHEKLTKLFSESDGLITDYSSSVFDFMLQKPNAPYYFYCPDYTEYKTTTGMQESFLKTSSIIIEEKELVNTLNKFPNNKRQKQVWHEFNDGNASLRVIELIDNYYRTN